MLRMYQNPKRRTYSKNASSRHDQKFLGVGFHTPMIREVCAYQRIRFAPQTRPAPKPTVNTNIPGLSLPVSTAS